MNMKLSIAGLAAGLALSALPASAATVSLTVATPAQQQQDESDCIFGQNTAGHVGCTAALHGLPTGAPGGSVTDRTHDYLVSDIRALVGNLFNVGIDSNVAQGNPGQTITKFTLSINNVVQFVLSPVPAGFDPLQNGNGFADYVIGLFDLSAYAAADTARFTVSLTGLSDGEETFFFLDVPDTAQVPLPAAIWLMGAGLAGLGFAGRKRKAV